MDNMEILDDITNVFFVGRDTITRPPKAGRSKSGGEDRVVNDKKQLINFSKEGY
jgi:hypothetical protein